jgi:integrase
VPVYEWWLKAHRDDPSFQVGWDAKLYDQLWTGAGYDCEREYPDGIPSSALMLSGMRAFCNAQADNAIEHYRLNVDDFDRSKILRAVGAAVQRASLVLEREALGIFASDSDSSLLAGPPYVASPNQSSSFTGIGGQGGAESRKCGVTLTGLFEEWWREAKAAGRKPSTYESYRNTVSTFRAFLTHNDAGRVTPEAVVAFKDHRLQSVNAKTGRAISPKTVRGSDLAALSTIFKWAVANRKVASDPTQGVKVSVPKVAKLRSKGLTDIESAAILRAALAHQGGRERPCMTAAKQWVPWLCAYTGARVGELAQLRREDLKLDGEHWIVRITPEAGTVKTNEAREVVLHPHLIELGFAKFVRACAPGHLFLRPREDGDVLGPLQGLKNRLAEFSRAIVPDPNVAPNHGWRHRFKTVGMEAGIAPRILDAIQGQAPRSVADTYGDVTLKTIADAISRLPRIEVAIAAGADEHP